MIEIIGIVIAISLWCIALELSAIKDVLREIRSKQK